MKPRHKIDKEYESNPRHIRRWELTIEWLKTFQEKIYIPYHPAYIIKGKCLDCGDRTGLTRMVENAFNVKVDNTKHDLNWSDYEIKTYYNIFIFEII